MNSFQEKTIRGINWSFANQFVNQVVNIFISLILARILSPKEFGLIAMVVVFTGFATVISDFSIGTAIIHRKDVTQKELSSVFWLNVVIGIALSFVFIGLSSYIAAYYDKEILRVITMAVSITFIFSSVNIVQSSLLKKNLDFKSIFIIQFISVIIAGACAIYLAMSDFGVWALVSQTVIQYFLITLITWKISKWRPSYHFNFSELMPFLRFSMPIFATRIINYFARSLDNLLIGKNFGSVELGVYSRSYTFMRLPVNNFAIVLHNVMFPSFSLIKDDKPRIKKIYLKIIEFVSMIVMPAMLFLFLTAHNFVFILLGEKWLAVIPILKVFCLVAVCESLVTLTGSIFMSQGKTKELFYVGTASRVLMILAIIYAVQFDILTVAKYFAYATVISTPLFMYYAGKSIDTSLFEVFRVLLPIIASSLVLIPIIMFLENAVSNEIFKFFIQAFVSAIVYLFIIYNLGLESFNTVMIRIKSIFNKIKNS